MKRIVVLLTLLVLTLSFLSFSYGAEKDYDASDPYPGNSYSNYNYEPSDTTVAVEPNVYSIHSVINDDLVIDVSDSGMSTGTNIQVQRYTGESNQRFNIIRKRGYYLVRAQCSNQLMDTENNSSTPGANVFTWDYTGAGGQHWEFVDAGDGYYYIRSKNGLYLDVKDGKKAAGTNLQVWSFNGSDAQKWKLVCETRSIEEGYYSIHSTGNYDLVLDIKDADQKEGANLQLWEYNGSRAQIFCIKKDGDKYIIRPMCSGLLIDTSENSGASGANLQQWSDTGAAGQRFQFIVTGAGNYYICSGLGMFVDITDGVYEKGTNIQSCRFNGTSAQKWKLVKEDVTRLKPSFPTVIRLGS